MPRRRGAQRASISDVAKAAGVSLGTVSNVLNRPERVATPTRDKVLAAIEALSFVPNGSARQLRAGTITTVGAIVPDIGNPYSTELARGIEDRLATADRTLMLASSDEDPAREARHLRLFEEHGVLGVLVTPAGPDVDHLLQLRRRGTDVVLLDRTSPHPEISSVSVDDVAGAAMAVTHLLEQGHDRVAMINGTPGTRRRADGRAGALRALREAGLDPATALVEVTVPTLDADGGVTGASQLLETGDHPSAIFCVNDHTALGAMRALRAHGLRIPQDVAVVGYGDADVASMLMTPLTSVRRPTRRIGEIAADLLLRSTDPGTTEAQQVEFTPELVVRTSSTR
ncbi:LacI family transcriptional regulator [Cellulomonas bogoriensis 69B4 = DSM 16987]|uniref:LacI family transcriptional regulator n=1 Tax=Cellulomonas bogoriensis 69B4 = DSM 16987 TaxID=1386082 RepID=A0A0A0BS29_9CELL|nr:LacI family transcriptional regulator [Cellulomonas bogoriensis 69B4 = DSM 16987]